MSLKKTFINGIIDENPTLRLVLGMCPTIATTTAAMNALGMGAAATFVLVGSNLVVSLLRNFIPEKVRIPAYVVIIATFVTIVEMMMEAFFPAIYESLGIFIPLIVVNCIILARAEAFASKNTPVQSLMDGLGMGVGFTVALLVVASIREIIGNGTIFGAAILPGYQPAAIMVLAPGGFFALAAVLGLLNFVTDRAKRKGGKAA